MTGHSDFIRFRLNNENVQLDGFAPGLTLLDYLRLDRKLCGTKEGCAEGDCGACTVLVGRLVDGELFYESVNACIRFVGSLNACHVVTVEHLKGRDGKLHPVQQAMVDQHASQCGFCTPGFVMSLYALRMTNPDPSVDDIETALQGNLCRCTGYEPIIRAARAVSKIGKPNKDPLVTERNEVKSQLARMVGKQRIEIRHGEELSIIPADLDDLAKARLKYPGSTIVAGSTDVGLWVTKFMQKISPAIFVSHLEELHQIETGKSEVTFGACVTYSEAQKVIGERFPQLKEFWNRIGGEQVRNMGTIGGNIANGSPIGDTPPPLIALGASVILRKGKKRRTVLLEDFFIDYGKQDRQEGDLVESLVVPYPSDKDLFAAYKISKRRDEDISSVCGVFRIRLNGEIVGEAAIAFGGMAATPKRAKAVETALVGKPWNQATVTNAMKCFGKDFKPLTDWRASADYRMLVSQNLLQRFFLETTGGTSKIRLTRNEAA